MVSDSVVKIADVGKEDRHLVAPPPQGQQPRVFQDLLGTSPG